MSDEVMDWLASVETELRQKKDRSDALDELFQLSFMGSGDVLEKVSWCLAKMAQNKTQDMRVYDILMSMYPDSEEDVKENIAWGLGELAGSGIGTMESLDVLKSFLSSQTPTTRASAAWAVGRYHHRLHLSDPDSHEMLGSMLDDPSELVRKSARFAIDDE